VPPADEYESERRQKSTRDHQIQIMNYFEHRRTPTQSPNRGYGAGDRHLAPPRLRLREKITMVSEKIRPILKEKSL